MATAPPAAMMAPNAAPPLPDGWVANWSPQYNQWYFVFPATGYSQWHHPSSPPPGAPAPASHRQQHYAGGGGDMTVNLAMHAGGPQQQQPSDASAPPGQFDPSQAAVAPGPAPLPTPDASTDAAQPGMDLVPGAAGGSDLISPAAPGEDGERGFLGFGSSSSSTGGGGPGDVVAAAGDGERGLGKTALAVGGGLLAGAFLEHGAEKMHAHHHQTHHQGQAEHHHHAGGLGKVAALVGAAGAGALGAKMFGLFGNKQQQQHQQGGPQMPTPMPMPPQGPGGYGMPPPPMSPPPAYGVPGGPPAPQQQQGGGMGGVLMGGAAGLAGGAALSAAASSWFHHGEGGGDGASGGGPSVPAPLPTPPTAGSSSSSSSQQQGGGMFSFFGGAGGGIGAVDGPRLVIWSAAFVDQDVTAQVRALVNPATQELNIPGEQMVEKFGNPWPDSKKRSLTVLYSYGDRPMEVRTGADDDGGDKPFIIRREAISTERMKFVNQDVRSRILAMTVGYENVMTADRVTQLETEGEINANDLGIGGYDWWAKYFVVTLIFYRTDAKPGAPVYVAASRPGGSVRLPWNPLAKWG